MADYYRDEDLDRFGEVGRHHPELFKKFLAWYQASLEPGALTKREKVLVALGVALSLQCPYCIDAYTKACLEEGMDMVHVTEVAHVASSLRGGAALIHAIQAQNSADKLTM